MAYPSPERTWYLKNNVYLPTSTSGLTDYRRVWLAIKNGLTDASGWHDLAGLPQTHLNPWTVQQSSNRASAGAADYWNAESDLTWEDAAVTGSWIVLRHPIQYGGSNGLRIWLYSYDNGYPHASDIEYDSHGFNLNGTINTPPTRRVLEVAPGDPTPLINIAWTWNPGAHAWWTRYNDGRTFNSSVHLWHSSDGVGTRILVMQDGAPAAFMLWDTADNLLGTVNDYGRAYWPDGHVNGMWLRANTLDNDSFDATAFIRAAIRANGRPYGPGWLSSTLSFASLWNFNDSSLMDRIQVANEISGNWAMEPMHLYGWTGGCRGLAGRLRDNWLVNNLSGISGTMFNAGALMKVGSLVFPWDNSTFNVGGA